MAVMADFPAGLLGFITHKTSGQELDVWLSFGGVFFGIYDLQESVRLVN